MHKPHAAVVELALAGLTCVACSNAEPPAGGEKTPGAPTSPTASRPTRPDVLLVLLDDVGFGHLSAYGGPIRTPNIDRIAARGVRYSSFHTTALCSPSRAALLTGRNHHSVGTGKITELASDDPGYTGRIPKNASTFVSALQRSGYATLALGKWHNTPIEDVTTHGPYDLWPMKMGFDHFYGFQGGDIDNWAPSLWADARPVDPHVGKPGYHLTTDLADHAVAFVDEHARSTSPFLVYLAPGVAHAPHHAPRSFIEANRGRFDQGWDRVREETFARQKAMGLLPESAELPPRPAPIPAWDSLPADHKALYAHMQEVFAAAVEHADFELGRVLAALERAGRLERTLVVVSSDNGASGEGGLEGSYNESRVFNMLPEDFALNYRHMAELGGPSTYNHYPAGWALAGNTPGRYWKQTVHEGGVRDPLIVSWPEGIAARGEVRRQFAHIVDLGPTILELAGVEAPREVDGVAEAPIEGVSFAQTLASASAPTAKKAQYFEMFGNRGVWSGGLKAVTFHGRWPWDTRSENPHFDADPWELYDLESDPNEAIDLAASRPADLARLKELFQREAEAHQVFPLSDSTASLIRKNLRRLLGDRTEFTFAGRTVRTSEALSPPIKGRSHTITARVVVPAGGADGVLVACGGRFGGYALYVKDGKLTYAHNYVGEQTYTITSRDRVAPGAHALVFELQATGPTSGAGRLLVDGKLAGTGSLPRLVPGIYSLGEPFDTGSDTATAVGDYEAPFPYRGELSEVKVSLGAAASSAVPPDLPLERDN